MKLTQAIFLSVSIMIPSVLCCMENHSDSDYDEDEQVVTQPSLESSVTNRSYLQKLSAAVLPKWFTSNKANPTTELVELDYTLEPVNPQLGYFAQIVVLIKKNVLGVFARSSKKKS